MTAVSKTAMRYNEAAFIGQKRSKEAQMKLFNYAGYAMLTYTIKQAPNSKDFSPVGEAILVAKMVYQNQIIVYLTDEDGFAKAQSKPMEIQDGEKLYKKIVDDGVQPYEGQIKTI
jgi:hypothetical protein